MLTVSQVRHRVSLVSVPSNKSCTKVKLGLEYDEVPRDIPDDVEAIDLDTIAIR